VGRQFDERSSGSGSGSGATQSMVRALYRFCLGRRSTRTAGCGRRLRAYGGVRLSMKGNLRCEHRLSSMRRRRMVGGTLSFKFFSISLFREERGWRVGETEATHVLHMYLLFSDNSQSRDMHGYIKPCCQSNLPSL
jgi:hypothetical protein